ncbi:MAG: Uma2 family endonuclease [Phormidesmis sp. CAN_BIN36]|nr:Uma2 family endonuclease [Phormidesmis sp. CAN_BIN36]
MVQAPQKTITLEEFLNLPDTKPASEYIDGQIIQKPMPQGEHSAIQGELISTINAVVRPQKIARTFPELRCVFGGRAIVPDVAVFTWDRIPRKENGGVANAFNAAPDWTIEILSPDQRQTKVTNNILHCLDHGCQMGWLVDPDEQSVIGYPFNQRPQIFDQFDQVLPVPEFAKDFRLTVGELFGWLLE